MFIDDKQHEYLQKRHQAIHVNVEALESQVEYLLSSFGVPTVGPLSTRVDALRASHARSACFRLDTRKFVVDVPPRV